MGVIGWKCHTPYGNMLGESALLFPLFTVCRVPLYWAFWILDCSRLISDQSGELFPDCFQEINLARIGIGTGRQGFLWGFLFSKIHAIFLSRCPYNSQIIYLQLFQPLPSPGLFLRSLPEQVASKKRVRRVLLDNYNDYM